jgi:hypothetical protein
MNTNLTTTRSALRHARRSAALGACLTLLFAGGTACGTDSAHSRGDGPRAVHTETHPNAPTSIDFIEGAKAAHNLQQQLLSAAQAPAWSLGHAGRHHTSTQQHPAGYNKALMAER